MANLGRFAGDGRKIVRPSEHLEFAKFPGRPLRRHHCRLVIGMFNDRGYSTHSLGITIWVIIEYCKLNDIPFQLYFMPGGGFAVERDS